VERLRKHQRPTIPHVAGARVSSGVGRRGGQQRLGRRPDQDASAATQLTLTGGSERGTLGLTTLDYLLVLKRRGLVVALAATVVTVTAVAVSLQREALYEASADVLIGRQNFALSLNGVEDPTRGLHPERVAETHAHVARVPAIARRVLDSLGFDDRDVEAFLGHSRVAAKPNADVLVFFATYAQPKLAVKLATAYAREFTKYRQQLDTTALRRAREEVEARIDELRARGEGQGAFYAGLLTKAQQLKTMEALQTSNTSLVRPARDAEQIQPQPRRAALFGLGLGLILGLGIAFFAEALDLRARSVDEIEQRLGLPLLARVPDSPRRARRDNELVTIARPSSIQAEAFRILRTNLEFANLQRGARVIMVTSGVEQEGKSETVSNLAVTLARGGRKVVLVDLDLRKPVLARYFDVEGRSGITDVALGHIALEDAIVPVAVSEPREDADKQHFVRSNGYGRARGLLEVLPAGRIPPNPGEFIESQALRSIFGELRRRAEVVLVDTPPILGVGDTMALTATVDALFVVSRLSTRRPALNELKRVLDSCPAPVLGFVATGVNPEDRYGSPAYHTELPHAHQRDHQRRTEEPARVDS
jgi:polysaccharide biosynthesis transport protein